MKRILRNKATRAYLSATGEWVTDLHFAKSFENMEAALAHVQAQHVKDAELVLILGQQPNDAYDIALPLSPARYAPPWA